MFRFWNSRERWVGTDDDDNGDDDNGDDDEEDDGWTFRVVIESIGASGGARVGETSVSKRRRRLVVAETKQEQAFEDKEEG